MDVKPPTHVPAGDKRFADPTWSENPAFFAVRQGYLAASQLVSDLLAAWRASATEHRGSWREDRTTWPCPWAGEREKPPMGSGRHQAIADATGRSAKPTASEEHHG